jgi:hypothetical protein
MVTLFSYAEIIEVKVELPVSSPGAESSIANDSEISRCGKIFLYNIFRKNKKIWESINTEYQ